jgi:hypothetical protein
MSFRHSRVRRLEACQRRLHPPERAHYRSVVNQPWEVRDREPWLAELTCPCGVVGCDQMTIGVIVPEKAPSADAWAARFQAYARRD